MQGIDPTLIVLVVLALVVAAAFTYQPSSYSGSWKLLAEAFESKNRPSFPTYRNENVLIDDYTQIDAEIDDEYLWLFYNGPSPKKAPPCLRIPWNKITLAKKTASQGLFLIEASKPVRMITNPEFGQAIARRAGRIPDKTE